MVVRRQMVKRQLKTHYVGSAYTYSCVFHLVVLRKVGEPLLYHGVVFTRSTKELECNTLPASRVKKGGHLVNLLTVRMS